MFKKGLLFKGAKLALALGISFGLSGCGHSIKLAEYKKFEAEQSQYAPSANEISNPQLPKVVMLDIDNNNLKLAKKASLGKSISTNLNTNLAQKRIANIVYRVGSNANNAQMLNKEIKAAELGRRLGVDVGQVDYLITGQLSNVSYDYDIVEGLNSLL